MSRAIVLASLILACSRTGASPEPSQTTPAQETNPLAAAAQPTAVPRVVRGFVTFLESTKEYRRDLRRVEYGDERQPAMRDFLERISPLHNADKIRAPMFVAQGQNDPRVPLAEAEQIVAKVRARGGEVWYMLAADEGHGFQKKANRDAYLAATAQFFERHLLVQR